MPIGKVASAATDDDDDGATCVAGDRTDSDSFRLPSGFQYRQHEHQNYRHLEVTVTVLWVLTPFLSAVSVIMVCVAITTNQWLLTQENMANPNYNGTGDNEYLPKSTVSGLWTLCYTNPGDKNLVCANIEYFPNEEYSPDPNDSTMAIPYTVTKSATFFILATFLLFLGEFYCLCGHFSHQRRLFTFISGVIFIISGLLMLIGLVMYISIFKAEIGGKLRPKSQLQPAVFTFQYGFSFILYVTGFVSTEISGTCAVFLYIYWHQKEWQRKRCEVRDKLASSAVLLNPPETTMMTMTTTTSYPLCKRHPELTQSLYISGKGLLVDGKDDLDDDDLYYARSRPPDTESDVMMPCLKHSNVCDALLEQYPRIYSNGNSDSIPSPPPEIYQCPWMSVLERNLTLGKNTFPRDATTNTVSTVADVELDDVYDDDDYDDEDAYSGSLAHEHKFITFDLDGDGISSSCRNNSSDHQFGAILEAFSKTTPV